MFNQWSDFTKTGLQDFGEDLIFQGHWRTWIGFFFQNVHGFIIKTSLRNGIGFGDIDPIFKVTFLYTLYLELHVIGAFCFHQTCTDKSLGW